LGVAGSPLGKTLGGYTPTPSTPSSTGTLSRHLAGNPPGTERPPLFGEGFPLRCLQRLSPTAWLPGSAL